MESWGTHPKEERQILSTSLGIVVIDEIRTPSHPPLIDIAGGSGIYGARSSPQSNIADPKALQLHLGAVYLSNVHKLRV